MLGHHLLAGEENKENQAKDKDEEEREGRL